VVITLGCLPGNWGSIPHKVAINAELAQLVERFVYTEDVGSSNLSFRTNIEQGFVVESGRPETLKYPLRSPVRSLNYML
jgi:hypothetical protein